MLSFKDLFFLIVFVCGSTRNRYCFKDLFFSFFLFVVVLGTDFELQEQILSLVELFFSHFFCLWNYSEQILSFKELFFLILFACGSIPYRYWVSRNCFLSFFLFVEVLGTDFDFQGTVLSHFFLFVEVLRTDFECGGTVFSHSFSLWKYSEQILSFKELFFLVLFVCGSTQHRCWVSRNCFFSLFLFVEVLRTYIEFQGTVLSHSVCLWKYSHEQILSFKELFSSFFLFVEMLWTDFECDGTVFSHFFLYVEVLGTDFEFQGTLFFFCLFKYLEQILSFKELYFLIFFVCGSTKNRYWVSRNCFFSLLLFVEVLVTYIEFHRPVFLMLFVCGSTWKRFWVPRICFSGCFCLWKYSEQILTFKELFFSHYFCLWKYSEQILSFQELFFLIVFVCASTQNIYWVSRNCFFSFFLFMKVLRTDFEFQGTVFHIFILFVEVLWTDFECGGTFFTHSFCLWKYSEQILSFKGLFFFFACLSTRNRFWVSRNCFFLFFCLWK